MKKRWIWLGLVALSGAAFGVGTVTLIRSRLERSGPAASAAMAPQVRVFPSLHTIAHQGASLLAARLELTASTIAAQPTPGINEVILTFDDGPDVQRTGEVLDLLKKQQIQAAFFVNGKNLVGKSESAEKRRALLQRAANEGHLIGNHTYSHKHLCAVSRADAEREIDDGEREIQRVLGYSSSFFRSPYGDRCQQLSELLAARNISHTHWDIDPQEWKTRNAELTFERVTAPLSHLRGRVIVLLHDIQPATVEALPRILDWMRARDADAVAAGAEATAVKKPIAIRVLSPAVLIKPEAIALLTSSAKLLRAFDSPAVAKPATLQ